VRKLNALLIMCFALVLASTVRAQNSGVNLVGNSLSLGVYSSGSAGFNYNAYQIQFTLDSTLATTIQGVDSSFQAGDTIIGMGISAPNAITFSGTPRLIAKFGGGTGDQFSASSTTTSPGDGCAGLSCGGTTAMSIYRDDKVGTGGILKSTDFFYWNGSSEPENPADEYVGVTNAIWNGNALDSVEILLDLNLLAGTGLPSPPTASSTGIMAVVDNFNVPFTDAFVPGFTAVPEPSTFTLLSAALTVLLATRRRRPLP
jgi:hypothetical protein